MKHIGQTIQTVLTHLVGIEGVKVPSESSNRRMILESNLLAKLQVGEKMLSHCLYFCLCPINLSVVVKLLVFDSD
jgi:hypothetical protein